MHHIDYGLGVLTARASRRLAADRPFDLGPCTSGCSPQASWPAWKFTERFYEIGSPEGLEETRASS